MAINVWQRFPFETDASYAAFSGWLHTPDRPEILPWSLTKEPAEQRSIVQWANEGRWIERARDFDIYHAEKVVIRQFPLVSGITLLMNRLAKTELERLRTMQERTDIPGMVPLNAVIRMASEVRKTEAEARKAQAALVEAANAGERDAYDFSRLSLDELRTLEALNEKARLSL